MREEGGREKRKGEREGKRRGCSVQCRDSM